MVIFADGADRASILELNKNPLIQGFTTNPTLLKKAGVKNYKEFATDILKTIDKPFSFEVIADDLDEMQRQAVEIASWGRNVYVKIPVTNTKGQSTSRIIEELNYFKNVKINVTAITTIKQVEDVFLSMDPSVSSYISVFAGRIADTGVDPLPIIDEALDVIRGSVIELIWASPREVFNIYQAESIGCHIITCTPDLIKKYQLLKDKNLEEYSLDTVKMFFTDANNAGYTI